MLVIELNLKIYWSMTALEFENRFFDRKVAFGFCQKNT